MAAVLDGVTAASLALMVVVSVRLAAEALIDPVTVGLAIVGAAVFWRSRINPTWLILGGGVVGLLRLWLGSG